VTDEQPSRTDPYTAPVYQPLYQVPVYYAAPQPPRSLALASMITGIIGVFFSLGYGFGFLPSLAAIITGHLARKRQPYARGMWLTGLICGYIGLGIALAWIIALVVIIILAVSMHNDPSAVQGTNT
jgi:hypothetical protein